MENPMAEEMLGVQQFKHRVINHYQCLQKIFSLYNTKEKLAKLGERKDVDTVCAYEYYQLKKGVLNENLIEYEAIYKEYFQHIKVPPPL
jgi:hypothetical protein